MAYRPYPSRERALRQLDRHYPGPRVPVIPVEVLRPMGEAFRRLREDTRAAAEHGFGAGAYVLAARRTGTPT
ncbi:hypothetical protein ACFXAZ_33350 [Streptomyces sp. NPDC059477]|uniref:hypothetical protein n=1 Tax=Streptomyces sp. NPDC059477 TaxID=3346847 RepID=UPI0036858FD9